MTKTSAYRLESLRKPLDDCAGYSRAAHTSMSTHQSAFRTRQAARSWHKTPASRTRRPVSQGQWNI